MSRGIERLKRVIWRLQETPKDFYLKSEIEDAIMHECGTDPRTITVNFTTLHKKLKWITCQNKRWYIENHDYY